MLLTDIKTQKSDRFLGHLAAGLLLSVLATGINVVKRYAPTLAKNAKTISWIKKCIDSRRIGEFFGSVPIPLIEVGLSLMKNVPTPLAKSVLTPVGLTAADSTTQKKIHSLRTYGFGTTALITSNEQIEETMKIAKSQEESVFLIEGAS